MTQAIRLLSSGPFKPPLSHPFPTGSVSAVPDLPDPFSDGALSYTTNGADTFPAPSAYASRRHAWVHVFPEGKIHQHPEMTMRYFKWGVSRMLLEADPCPDLVPMWIEGFDQVMHESREFPRFLPRVGKQVSVTFGQKVDVDRVFGDLRERWRKLQERASKKQEGHAPEELGVLRDDELRVGDEAVKLREECTLRVRREVLKLRLSRGLPAEDPKASLVETWREEGGKKEGHMEDGSWVKDT
ncbi:Lysophosphatidylcholine acyltransferase-like protein [Elsinoe fawcettii]|nr:Lysophosphatidylcholine acyltransferase-like protein [Elsinoe fawcettii]